MALRKEAPGVKLKYQLTKMSVVCTGGGGAGFSTRVSRGEKLLYSGTDPESYITEYTLLYEDKSTIARRRVRRWNRWLSARR